MNTRTYGVAIVGCGNIGRTHAATVEELDNLNIVALVDEMAPAATALADSLESKGDPRPATYTTLAEALTDPAVDLVVIATPSGLHIEQGLAVLAADKHLIIEKPLDVDLTRAQEIETAAIAAQDRGIVSSVISQHRFDPASQIVSKAVTGQRFGRLTSAIASVGWWRSQEYYDSGDWRGTWAMDGGGALMNQGVHTVDLLLWFMGTPVQIHAHTRLLAHERMEVEDTAVATIVFESGALAVLHATTAAYPSVTVRVQVMGNAGSAVIDSDELTYFHAADSGEKAGPFGLDGGGNQATTELSALAPPRTLKDASTNPAGHIRQYEDVLQAIENGTNPGVRITDAVLALATIRAVYISSTIEETVLFEDVLAGKYNDITVRTGK